MTKGNKPVAVFDIDGTIFRNSLLVELHWKMVKAGIIPRSAITLLDKRYWRWVERRGSYDDYLADVIESFNTFVDGVPTKTVQQLARQVVRVQSRIVYRYTRDLVEKLRKTHLLVAISGSPQIVVGEFARAWKFDYYIGTQHAIRNGAFVGNKVWVASADKVEALKRLQKDHGFLLGKKSIGVGDTISDAKIFNLVEHPICINPTADLYMLAHKKKWHVVFERKNTIIELKKGRVIGVHAAE